MATFWFQIIALGLNFIESLYVNVF